jgi:hypothetical protein
MLLSRNRTVVALLEGTQIEIEYCSFVISRNIPGAGRTVRPRAGAHEEWEVGGHDH